MTTIATPSVFTSHAKEFVDYISGETEGDNFLKSKGFEAFAELKDDGLDWAKSHVEGEPDNKDHINPEYVLNALKYIRNYFYFEKINFAVDPDLANVLCDKEFVKAVENDKKHICYMKGCIGDLLSNCPAAVHFINVGWFDEPFDHQDIHTLLEIFDKSLDLATNMIIEEKTGTYFRSRFYKHDGNGCEGLFAPLEQNDDSWDEWVHIFPNTIKFFLGDKFNLEKHLEDRHNFSKIKHKLRIK